jgi:hypothetical protein
MGTGGIFNSSGCGATGRLSGAVDVSFSNERRVTNRATKAGLKTKVRKAMAAERSPRTTFGLAILILRSGTVLLLLAAGVLAIPAFRAGGESTVTETELDSRTLGRPVNGIHEFLDQALSRDRGKVMVIVYHPDCSFSDLSLGAWKNILDLHRDWQVVGITTDRRPQGLTYLDALGLDSRMEIHQVASSDLHRILKFVATPVTLLVDDEGVVERVRCVSCFL